MKTYRKNAVIVGVLFIIATLMLFVGSAIHDPILGSPDFLETAYPNRLAVTIGVLLEFTKVPAILLIPVVLFPVLRKRNEVFALAYVAFRLFEAVLLTIIDVNRFSLINISRDYLNRGGLDAAYFQVAGNSIQSVNEWTFTIYLVIFTAGALFFYAVLYRSRLIPRFISGWGFLAAALLLIGTLLIMVEALAGISDVVVELILATPIAVNEMVLAVWLIVKGFDSSAIVAGSATGAVESESRGLAATGD